MPCDCGYADECDGEHATHYPLQDGGMYVVRPCRLPASEPKMALALPETMWHSTPIATRNPEQAT